MLSIDMVLFDLNYESAKTWTFGRAMHVTEQDVTFVGKRGEEYYSLRFMHSDRLAVNDFPRASEQDDSVQMDLGSETGIRQDSALPMMTSSAIKESPSIGISSAKSVITARGPPAVSAAEVRTYVHEGFSEDTLAVADKYNRFADIAEALSKPIKHEEVELYMAGLSSTNGLLKVGCMD
jgi:hypothetical protein